MAKKNKSNKKMMMSLFIIAIMVLSAFGFVMSYQTSQAEKLKPYNGYKFTGTPQGFMTKINDNEFYFKYYPGDIEAINTSVSFKDALKNKKVISVTYDPDSEFASLIAELQFDMEQKFSKYGSIFLTKGLTNATGYTLPEVTCADATEESPVIYFKKGEKSDITAENSCIILEAETEPAMNAYYTKILYVLFGVMK